MPTRRTRAARPPAAGRAAAPPPSRRPRPAFRYRAARRAIR
ncbi:extensin [Azospirillum sp. TSA2s]|nr:extensin [Azospirillum sp. TSA2s]